MTTKELKAYEIPVADMNKKPSGKVVWHMADQNGVFLVCPYKASQLPCGNWCMHFTCDTTEEKGKKYAYCKNFKLGEVVEVVKYKEIVTAPDGKKATIIRPN